MNVNNATANSNVQLFTRHGSKCGCTLQPVVGFDCGPSNVNSMYSSEESSLNVIP